jgi:Tfp pilus assembly protein PilO
VTAERPDRKLTALHGAGATACLVVVATFWWAGLRPLLGRAAAAATAHHRLAAAVQQRDAADAAVRDGTDQLQQLGAEVAASGLSLRPPSQVNDVLARVASVSANCGVRLDDVRVGSLARGERYATLPVHAVGRGAYRDCVRFLRQLNRDCPDVAVAALGLAGPGAGAAGPVGIDLDLRWHAALPTLDAR